MTRIPGLPDYRDVAELVIDELRDGDRDVAVLALGIALLKAFSDGMNCLYGRQQQAIAVLEATAALTKES